VDASDSLDRLGVGPADENGTTETSVGAAEWHVVLADEFGIDGT
jgi:hypothetical protein